MNVKQISVFLENRPGALLEMVDALAKKGVNMRAFSLAETSDFGIARIIAGDVEKTSAALTEAGYVNSVAPVLAVEIPDRPGGLEQVLTALGNAQVNVEYMYAFVGPDPQSAYMIFRVADNDRACAALTEAGVNLLEQETLETL